MAAHRTEVIHVRVTPEEVRDIKLLSRAKGVSQSELIREVVREHVARLTGSRATDRPDR